MMYGGIVLQPGWDFGSGKRVGDLKICRDSAPFFMEDLFSEFFKKFLER